MKEPRYYTPTIEEFHVGFLYEKRIFDDNLNDWIWNPCVVRYNEDLSIIDDLIDEQDIRVKSLDKDDILI